MSEPHAAQRVRARIAEWLQQQGHGAKTRLAAAVPSKYGQSHGGQWVTGLLKGRENKGQDLSLKDLDAVADLLEVPPGDLVRRDDRLYMELTVPEARLIQRFRSLPEPIRQHCLACLDYLFSFHDAALERDRMRQQDATRRMRQFESPGARRNTGT